jgi:replicative DNA helicase
MNRKKYQPKEKLVVRDITDSLGKLPPQALDLEEAILGALMLEKNAIVEVASSLRADHFYHESHRTIYEAIISIFSAGEKIDMRTVVNAVRKAGKLELVGGAYKIAELTSKVSSAANIEYHTRILIEFAMKRSLIMMASEVHHDAYEETIDVFNIIEKTNLNLQEILDNAISGKADKSMAEITFEVIKEQQARQSGKHTGLDSGYPVVDAMLNGFQKTDLIIVAARPGMGKTSWVMQAVKNIAEKSVPVGVFSLEMGAKQLVERMAIAESEIEADVVKKGRLDPYEWQRYMAAHGGLAKLPIHIDDTAFMTIVELRARAMRMKSKHNIQLLVIDYLQLIKGINEFGNNMTRDQEIGVISRTLKGVAKELDIPVIALSQLSRSVETRGGLKRPMLSDLRESGSIEQDADVVMFLYRPEYYKITQDEDGLPTHGLCECIIEKHRNGATGTVKQKFIGKHTKFANWISETTIPVSKARQQYADKHYKNPTEELPKEGDDLPF